jgi:spore coat protein U-like protein
MVPAIWLVALLTPSDVEAGSPTCNITATTIAFGDVDVLPGAAVDATATFTVSCSGGGGNGQRLCISMGSGANVSGSQRVMIGPGGALLKYELYEDAARTIPWGSWQTGFNSSGVQRDVSQNTTTNITVYTRVLATQQTLAPGAYSTTFTAEPYLQYDDKGTAACPTGIRSHSASTSVTATVASTCTVTANTLNFGNRGLLTSNIYVTGTLTPRCSNGLPYNIALNGGTTGATDPTQRKMVKGAEQVTYGLYRDGGRTQPWGGTTGTNTVPGTGSGASQAISVYGLIPVQTTRSPGLYSDAVTVTVTF